MSDLTAIDFLIGPDEHALSRAREVNARVLRSSTSKRTWWQPSHHSSNLTAPQRRS